MTDAAFALQKAIHARLTADASLLAALRGPRIYDDVPQRAEFPYMTFGQSTQRDWSTASDNGSEHVITLHVWSRAHGRKEALSVLSAARLALHEADMTLDGHRLVNFRHEFSDARRDPDGESYHGTARFRAVTEEI